MFLLYLTPPFPVEKGEAKSSNRQSHSQCHESSMNLHTNTVISLQLKYVVAVGDCSVRYINLEPDLLAEQSFFWPLRFIKVGDEGTNTSC